MTRTPFYRLPRIMVAAGATVVGVVLAVVGVSIWPLAVAATVLWIVVVASRWQPYSIAAPAVVVASGLVLLGVMTVLPLTGLPLYATFVVLWTLAAVAAAALLADPTTSLPSIPRVSLLVWLSPLAGSVVWLGSIAISALVPAATHYAWVTNGDSANNILFAREIVYRDGIAVGAGENPVPLPSGLLALSMGAGRSSTAASDLLRHDVVAFVIVWGLVIAAVCYFAGLTASAVVSRTRPWLAAAAGAGVSLVPLSWYVGGYPIEFGFFSVHIALVLIFLAWLVCLGAQRAPALVLATLMGASTLLLAVWSPLVLMPVALGVYVVVSRFRALLATRGVPLVILGIAFVQVVVYGAAVTLPSLLAQAGFLSAQGGIFPFSHFVILAVLVGAVVLAVVILVVRRGGPAWMLVAIAVGSAAGLGALLFLNRDGATPWTYYPVKFAWIASVIGTVLVLGALLGLVSKTVSNRYLSVGLVVVLAGATVFSINWPARAVPDYVGLTPVARLFATAESGGGDAVIKRVFDAANPERPTVYWNSGDPAEGTLNFWTLQIAADSTTENHDLRVFAYGYYDLDDTADLCEIVGLIDGPVVVQTSDAGLPDEIDATCPDIAGSIQVVIPR